MQLDAWHGAAIVPELVLPSLVNHRNTSNNTIPEHATAATRHSGGPIAIITISEPISVPIPKSVCSVELSIMCEKIKRVEEMDMYATNIFAYPVEPITTQREAASFNPST
jgi:hypothetical protein